MRAEEFIINENFANSRASLASMYAQDQAERNEFKTLVHSKAGGDYTKGGQMYAQLKGRPGDSIFGDEERQDRFMKMKFDFDTFTDDDWDNYWMMAQHCDKNRDFQRQALAAIEKYQGQDHGHYHYLYDRISCGTTGTQKYGTQDGCNIDSVNENFADGQNPVKFTVTTPDGYTHSFQITLAVHGKRVGHFNFVRDADTDDVNNEAEVESRWQGQGYGKLLLMKAIDVANNHRLDFQQDIRGITDAQQNVYDSLENDGLIVTPGDGFWFLTPQGEQELNGLNENFADGKHPEDKGDSKRLGVPTKSSVSNLRKYAKSHSGRAAQLANWAANMKAGRAKKNKTNEDTVATINLGGIIVNMDDHALDRQQQRGIGDKSFDAAIRKLKLPRVIKQMSQLEVGNRFYVLDHTTNVALGMRKIGDNKYVLKTVFNGRPADHNIAGIITV